jgi:hypothetical protein
LIKKLLDKFSLIKSSNTLSRENMQGYFSLVPAKTISLIGDLIGFILVVEGVILFEDSGVFKAEHIIQIDPFR